MSGLGFNLMGLGMKKLNNLINTHSICINCGEGEGLIFNRSLSDDVVEIITSTTKVKINYALLNDIVMNGLDGKPLRYDIGNSVVVEGGVIKYGRKCRGCGEYFDSYSKENDLCTSCYFTA